MTETDALPSSCHRGELSPSIHALPSVKREGYSMRGALRGVPNFSFRAILDSLYEESFTLYHPKSPIQCSLSITSQFCKALVNSGYLSFDQMLNATWRYRLGESKNGGVIFWQINRDGWPHDGKIMYYLPNCHRDKSHNPTWVSYILARREGYEKGGSSHCLFGLHLLREVDKSVTIAVVEAEKTAVIMSEHFPQYIWLAAGGLGELQPDKFRPLRERKIILFPDTDPDGIAFKRWSDISKEVMNSIFWEDSPPIRVSPILEQHATPDQKQRKIDLVDFLFDSCQPQP